MVRGVNWEIIFWRCSFCKSYYSYWQIWFHMSLIPSGFAHATSGFPLQLPGTDFEFLLAFWDKDNFICSNFKIKWRVLYLWICVLHQLWSHLNGIESIVECQTKIKEYFGRSIAFFKLKDIYLIQTTQCVIVISLKQISQMSHPSPSISKGWHHFCVLYW